jgi:hypothetical protein
LTAGVSKVRIRDVIAMNSLAVELDAFIVGIAGIPR